MVASASRGDLDSFTATIVLGRDTCGGLPSAASREWLVTNGIGGYASGTVAGLLTRRYHGILMAALNPPIGRRLFVAKLDDTVAYDGTEYPLYTNRWADGTVEPHGYRLIERFALDGAIPTWRFACADALIDKRVWMQHGANTTYVRYDLTRASGPMGLTIRAFVNARPDHGTTRGNDWTMFVEPAPHGVWVTPYHGARPIVIAARGASVEPAHTWHVGFDLIAERERGLDSHDDHLHAATFRMTLAPGGSLTITASAEQRPRLNPRAALAARRAHEQGVRDCGRTAMPVNGEPIPGWIEQLTLAADQFIVRRATPGDPRPLSVIAGYPWFGDWGRDTMIALPGLTLATGRSEIARAILTTYARHVVQGLLPNRLDDAGGAADYNTVDAALWYVEAIRAYHAATRDDATLGVLCPVVEDIVAWYAKGTRFGIRQDASDGLIAIGEAGAQATWMDAKVGEHVITPRAGKPVEVNALWYNALRATAAFARRMRRDERFFTAMAERTREGFARYWRPEAGCCYDALDGPEGHDASVRPNQLFAVSLPESPLSTAQQRAVLDVCARKLLTSHGLRSLAADDPRYVGHYQGDVTARDSAYHQGTVWGWLLGPFALAHLRVHRDPVAARRFLEPMARHLAAAGVGTLSEIFDGDPPYEPRGCIAQAWTVAEVLRAWTAINSFRRTRPAGGRGAGPRIR